MSARPRIFDRPNAGSDNCPFARHFVKLDASVLTSSQTPTQAAAGQSTTYAYGSKGNPGETQGQLKQRTVPGTNGQTAVYTRDALGLVTQAEGRNGSNSLVVAYTYTYDPAQRLRTVTDSRGGNETGRKKRSPLIRKI